jgi:hypothetical protein
MVLHIILPIGITFGIAALLVLYNYLVLKIVENHIKKLEEDVEKNT